MKKRKCCATLWQKETIFCFDSYSFFNLDFDKLSLYSAMYLNNCNFLATTVTWCTAEIVELLAKQLVDRMLDAKENIDGNIIASLRKEHLVEVISNHMNT